jgi:hypothetical protein
MNNIKNQDPVLRASSCTITKNNATCWGYKLSDINNLENYIYMEEGNSTIAELFPTVPVTDQIKNDVFFGVVVDTPSCLTINKEIVGYINELECLSPSEFLRKHQSFREEDSYIETLHKELFSELLIKPATNNIDELHNN